MKTDHWFYGLFQSAPDLIALLLPAAGVGSGVPSLAADGSGDALYRFDAPELKAVNHRLDGVFWPRGDERGTPERPVVLLEVQMHSKPGFKHLLWAQTARFAQLHPQYIASRWSWWCLTAASIWGRLICLASSKRSLKVCIG